MIPQEKSKILILGVGNSLLSDDGFGIHVIDKLRENPAIGDNVVLRDGGTIGLSLLPEIEECDELIVVDAAQLGEKPGFVKIVVDDAMDDHLSKHKSTVHEVAMVDLLFAARLSGKFPRRRTLIAAQPENVDWGLKPTAALIPALDIACDHILSIINEKVEA